MKTFLLAMVLGAYSTAHGDLYDVGGQVTNKKTGYYLTLACEQAVDIKDCKRVTLAEGDPQGHLKPLKKDFWLDMTQMPGVEQNVGYYMRHGAYYRFTPYPISQRYIDDINDLRSIADVNFGALLVLYFGLLITIPADIVFAPVTYPSEVVQIGWEHLTFPLQSLRMQKWTHKMPESDFNKKLGSGKYQRLKKALQQALK